ncbi:alkyl hydroperoxide reductase subunit F [Sphingomonas floccifaciens]|uniref:Thioredoxin reductase n=1 Tax=Sphingomonas floccifaciens TaxID=1844115 RepID=A0ABW4NBI5_9SPHN
MLDESLKSQLKAYLANLRQPVELVASLDEDAKSRDMWSLLNEIAELHADVSVVRSDDDARRPSFLIRRVGTEVGVRFAGIPLGHEFTSLVLALLHVGGHPPKMSEEVQAAIRELPGDYEFETYFSLTCQNCPDLVQALNAMSVINPRIRHTSIEGGLFRGEIEARQIMSVPSVFLNGQPFAQGRMDVEQILAKLDTNADARAAEKIAAKEPFDVLVVGGGPAGAAAAIYAARKGIRTGLATERFGGQVLDTLAIENFISVQRTEGPKLVAQMESHVAEYGVDVMTLQRAEALFPARSPGGLHEVRLESGATLRARSVILSTGARWRSLGVPGEDTYRNRGVTYCPHCDGPLFKGKRVAVVGGGNSGVEAAIDLAGVVAHVTLLEFGDQLRADAVLQRKLRSLSNVTVLLNAQTTAIDGDGGKVDGLTYVDRAAGETRRVHVEGVFVQIGLVPNTDWLRGVLDLSPHGEIEVDAHGRTSVPGVFAAGDATTTPFKQIVIAMGEGSKASLSAFDHLIRMPASSESEAA